MKRAIVAGATGAVGRALVNRLRENDGYGEVHLLLRRRTGATNPKLVEHLIEDFGQLDQVVIEGTVDQVFCTLGTTRKKAGSKEAFQRVDHDFVVAVGKLAARLDSEMAVVTSTGASASSNSFYLRVKGQAEQSLIDLGLRRLVLARPSLLIVRRKKSRPFEELAIWSSRCWALLMVGPLRRFRPIRVEDVADSLIESLGHEGPSVEVIENEDLLSQAESRFEQRTTARAQSGIR